jgi:signal transduction histidine kinase
VAGTARCERRLSRADQVDASGAAPARILKFVLPDEPDFVLPDEAADTWPEYRESVKTKAFQLFARHWFDALIVVGLGLGLAVVIEDVDAKNGPQGPLWFDVLAVVAMTVPLFGYRRFPFGAPVATGLVLGLSSFVDNRLVPASFIATLIGIAALVLFGISQKRPQTYLGLAAAVGMVGIVVRNDPKGKIGDFVFVSIVFTVAWIVGFAIGRKLQEAAEARERAARAEREREERAHMAVSDERARIARELHDVVGHSVSVMTVQASAVRMLLRPDQEREREALLVVEQTGREALAEMRRMVGILRRPEEAPALAPQPSLEHLDALVQHTRDAGLSVDLRVEGEPVQLSAGVDLTAYRLVQEGLTNAMKHANAKHADVLVRYSDGHVELTVSDDGPGGTKGEGSGHGLVGMRERVAVYGGDFEAGPGEEGGYTLRARLPVT